MSLPNEMSRVAKSDNPPKPQAGSGNIKPV
jgi:hypothetical protein